eukprot:scaffold5632_cov146-Skeletonema_marinoi.AAC.22
MEGMEHFEVCRRQLAKSLSLPGSKKPLPVQDAHAGSYFREDWEDKPVWKTQNGYVAVRQGPDHE